MIKKSKKGEALKASPFFSKRYLPKNFTKLD